MIKILLNGNGENKEYKLVRIGDNKYLLLLNDENTNGVLSFENAFEKIAKDNSLEIPEIINLTNEDDIERYESNDYIEFLLKQAKIYRKKAMNSFYGASMKPDFIFRSPMISKEPNIKGMNKETFEKISTLSSLLDLLSIDKKDEKEDPIMELFNSINKLGNLNDVKENFDTDSKIDLLNKLKDHDCENCIRNGHCHIQDLKEKLESDVNNKEENHDSEIEHEFDLDSLKLLNNNNNNRKKIEMGIISVYGKIVLDTIEEDRRIFPKKDVNNLYKVESLLGFYDKIKELLILNYNSEKSVEVLIYSLTEDYLIYFKNTKDKSNIDNLIKTYFNKYENIIVEKIKNY